jgi:hypothetical protein
MCTAAVMANHHGDSESAALVDRTCRLLRQYVHQQPLAADSVEGIALWWLPDGGVGLPAAVLDQALHRLADEGVLGLRTQASGRALWFALPGSKG